MNDARDQLMEEFGPKTYDEAAAAARAVIDHRDFEKALDHVEQLSEFESALIEIAFDEGRRDAVNRIDVALGSSAATADVAALRTALSQRRSLDAHVPGPPAGRRFVDPRVAMVVSSARRRAAGAERAGGE